MLAAFQRRSHCFFAIIGSAVALLLPCCPELAHCGVQPEGRDALRWLVLGPFPNHGYNSFYKDFLKPSGGERKSAPRQGDRVVSNSGLDLRWREAFSDTNGLLDVGRLMPNDRKGIAYAYTQLPSQQDQTVAATFGFAGSLQVWLNGTLVHELRISRKPEPDTDVIVLKLKKGLNAMLVKVEGTQPSWGFYFKEYRTPHRLFVNERGMTIPDFRVGAHVGGWSQVEVANTSTRPLPEVTVEILGNGFLLPSRSAPEALLPGEGRRIPIWLATSRPVPDGPVEPFQLLVSSAGESRIVQWTPRVRSQKEYFVTTYRSHLDGSVQPYSMLIPTSYDPGKAYPLVLLLHGAWVTGWAQNIVSYDPKEWIIQVAPHDRGNNRYRDVGQVDLDEVLDDVKRRYRIDDDRIFLAGHSMGGYGTWFQATRRPDRWAAISPQAGYADYVLYHPAMNDTRGSSGFQRKLLEEWSPLLFAENLRHIPAYIIHGAKDDNVAVEHSRKMAARLQELSYTFVYDENPDGGHWWGPRGTTYGMEVVDKPPIWTFLREHSPRKKYPQRVMYKTNTLRYHRAYWVSIDELDTLYAMAQIDAEIVRKNSINITSHNITQFTIHLNDTLVTAQLPVQVTVNGKLVFNGLLPRSFNLTLRRTENGNYVMLFGSDDLAGPSVTGGWSVAAELDQKGKVTRFMPWNDERLKKTPWLFGPVVDAFNSAFLFVVGTSASSQAHSQALQWSAVRVARNWEAHANGIVRLKNDTDLTAEDFAENNLVLFGDEKSNSVLRRINKRLPVRFSNGKLVVGKNVYVGEDIGAILIYPNPLNPGKYVVVVGGTTPYSFELAARIPLAELPDYVVFDRTSFETQELRYRAAGFFDKYWKLTGD